MQLNFEKVNIQVKTDNNGNRFVFDIVRKKNVALTPEEWVRQHVLHTLIAKGYSSSRISIERSLPNSKKRYDAIYYNIEVKPSLLVECKRPSVPIDEKTLQQVTSYIQLLNIPHILLTNGLQHFFISRDKKGIQIVNEIPLETEIKSFFLPPKSE